MDINVVFETDPETKEATGVIAPFCSEMCRTHAGGINMKRFHAASLGTSSVSDFGYSPRCELCGMEISGSMVDPKSRMVPSTPLAVESSISTINCTTTIEQATTWMAELNSKYTEYYGSEEWNWNDTHDCDRDIFVELEEVIRGCTNPPIDKDLVCSFMADTWRKAYRN